MVIMNFSYSNENKLRMAKKDTLIAALVILMKDDSLYTRRYASTSLFTVACVVVNTSKIASQYDGAILEALRQVLINDPSQDARTNAAEAFFNMVIR
mmetsp:Transcript_17979/g.20725  ORF Transcript_17979/g.20725 Transcript_17979/m.20725 type:complete len:97 (-) Transcript_17979:54-344(-)